MLSLLKVFDKVVQYGSFTKAARVLQVAPSSVTRSIDNLETKLGVSLFKRSSRHLALTDEGKMLSENAKALLAHADDVVSALTQPNLKSHSSVRVSVFESFGRIYICPLVSEYLSLNPEMSVELELENRFVDLVQEDIDIAIRIGNPPDSSLKARRLFSNKSVICMAPSYANKHGKPEVPEDLRNHNCLPLNIRRQKIFWYFKKDGLEEKINVTGSLTSTSGTPLIYATLAGLGVAQVPLWMARKYLEEGTLVTCLDDWTSSVKEGDSGMVYMVFRNDTHLKPSVRSFIDFICEKTIQHEKNA